MAKNVKEDFVISIEGIGNAGKTTQIRLLTESLWNNYNIAAHKIINRKLLEDALKPLSNGPKEKFWVAYFPQVEIGVDLLVHTALYDQRFVEIRKELPPIPYVIVVERYLYSGLMHATTRAVLREMAGFFKSGSFAPEFLAEVLKKEALEKNIAFMDIVEQYTSLAIKNTKGEVNRLYEVFLDMEKIIKWPNLVFVMDVPVEKVRYRELKRENRAYTDGDVIYWTIAMRMYRLAAEREPSRIFLIDGTQEQDKIAKEISKIVKKKCKLRDYRKH
ncbi:MAG: hypothetical protein LVQ95_04670 [Candidatus Micrarchaeales archaeon]|nr:hypothetical protein [Candidatus Micrarchaeales archaeon]